MDVEPPPHIQFHGDGIDADLTGHGDGRSLLRLRLTEPDDGIERILQVIFQPVDERGMARGFAVVLADEALRFTTVLGGDPSAFVWLPAAISFHLAWGCYYRVLKSIST